MMTCKDVSTLVSTGDLPHAPLARRLGVHTFETRVAQRLLA